MATFAQKRLELLKETARGLRQAGEGSDKEAMILPLCDEIEAATEQSNLDALEAKIPDLFKRLNGG